jgi:arginine N-succinyltransferase
MRVIRLVQEKDLDALMALAQKVGVGLTSLVPDEAMLKKKITDTLESIQTVKPNGYYFFVCEVDNQVVGCSGIDVMPGLSSPFYSYKISTIHQTYVKREIHSIHKIMQMGNDFEDETELCGLFLLPEYRNKINGYLLSYARFLYMALYPERFTPIVIAEIRGHSDEHGLSPFFESVGKHFYHIDFSAADKLTGLGDKEFIHTLKPTFPIYVDLLPQSAQAVIGVPHKDSLPAFNLLKKQGFFYNHYVDIFDAGPMLMCQRNQIQLIRDAKAYRVQDICDDCHDGLHHMAVKLEADFAVYHVKLKIYPEGISLSRTDADLLKVGIGDAIFATILN